jgi:hypothetical protein
MDEMIKELLLNRKVKFGRTSQWGYVIPLGRDENNGSANYTMA